MTRLVREVGLCLKENPSGYQLPQNALKMLLMLFLLLLLFWYNVLRAFHLFLPLKCHGCGFHSNNSNNCNQYIHRELNSVCIGWVSVLLQLQLLYCGLSEVGTERQLDRQSDMHTHRQTASPSD